MTPSINQQEYQQAQQAYIQGNYEEAAALVAQLVENFPDDPSSRLLRGHIYCVSQQYDLAREDYQMVLTLTKDPEFIDCANNSLESVDQYQSYGQSDATATQNPYFEDNFDLAVNSPASFTDQGLDEELSSGNLLDELGPNSFDFSSEYEETSDPELEQPFSNPFETLADTSPEFNAVEQTQAAFSDPFATSDNTSRHDALSSPEQFDNHYFSFDADADESLSFEEVEFRPLYKPDEWLKADQAEDLTDTAPEADFAAVEPHHQHTSYSEIEQNVDFLAEHNEFDDIPDLELFSLEPESSQIVAKPALAANAMPLASDVSNHDTASSTPTPAVVATSVQDFSNQNWLARFENASLEKKQWLTASAVGIVSSVVVATVSFGGVLLTTPDRAAVRNHAWAVTAAAGIAGFATTRLLGQLMLKQIKQTTTELKTQFDAIQAGNFNAQATIRSTDEFGLLAAEFNQVSRFMLATTTEAQSKVEEQARANAQLQSQLMQLLDDVQGAARGDLTVRAEVGDNVLGAVADSFNLTIQNLREIVQQVKMAVRHVSQEATDSERFAQGLSANALRQAEQLSTALNSVEVMTDAVQRVVESARTVQSVVYSASTSAKKGGEAVEKTVTGILDIRQTMAETTRKVKRLAESSQEVSQIVALTAQIAARINLSALNASVEATRASSPGRIATVVELQQLANRVAKALKEIEQIVGQIQSETSSVIAAMEAGSQQAMQGTYLAEQALQSLEDVMQVSNRIDTLIFSMNSDIAQTDSDSVVTVMRSMDSTAQANSQAADRVTHSLQNLVRLADSLLTAVEQFRVENKDLR